MFQRLFWTECKVTEQIDLVLKQIKKKTAQLTFYAGVFDFQEAKYSICQLKRRNLKLRLIDIIAL